MAPRAKPKTKAKPKAVAVADKPLKPKVGRPATGNAAIQLYKGEPDEGSATKDLPMQRFFERIDIPTLEDALALSTEKRYTELLRVMHHPVTRTWSLTRIAKRCGLTLVDLTKFWRDSRMQQAMLITSNALPGIMTDIVHDASNKPATCPRCDGYGTLLDDRAELPADVFARDDNPQSAAYDGRTALDFKQPLRPCPECHGTGEITARGDGEARKMLLEAAGVTGKRAPVIMNQHNHFPGSVENFVDKWDKEDASDIIDAEMEDVKPAGAAE